MKGLIMPMDKMAEIAYWSKKLEENTEQVSALRTKLNDTIVPLKYEEQFAIREALNQYRCYSTLLRECLDKPDPIPLPFYKKLFYKLK